MTNTPHNLNEDRSDGIEKLFLPYGRRYGEKIKDVAKQHGVEVIFTKDTL